MKSSKDSEGHGNHIVWHKQQVCKYDRSSIKYQHPLVVWFTGLSGSGKSTLANALEFELHRHGRHTYLLDGDNLRHGLNKDLGFTEQDRTENIRRIGEVARLMVDAGLIVIAAFISPYRRDRQMLRKLVAPGEFLEVYVNTPIEVCEQRDPKGLYKLARSGSIRNFTGIDAPYEKPVDPCVRVDTSRMNLKEALQTVQRKITDRIEELAQQRVVHP